MGGGRWGGGVKMTPFARHLFESMVEDLVLSKKENGFCLLSFIKSFSSECVSIGSMTRGCGAWNSTSTTKIHRWCVTHLMNHTRSK